MARGAQALSLSDVSLPTSGLPRDELVTLAAELDGAGFAALEVLDGERYRACLEAGQDPWEELRAIRAAAPNTPLRAALRGQSLTGERHVADDAVELFLRQAADCGVDVFRVFDPLDDPRNLRTAIAAARGLGRRVEGALCFAVGPVHDLDRWRDAAGRLAELGVDALAIRDTSGLLTPLTARELVRALRETTRLPVSVHATAAGGLASMAYLAAAEAGADAVDTVLSPLAGATGPPAAESVVAALAGGEHDTGLGLQRLGELRDAAARLLAHRPDAAPPCGGLPDSDVVRYQVPGLLLADVLRQLEGHGAAGRLPEVLAEVPRISDELGWPPLVAPVRQLVAAQAVYNALGEGRYETVTQELKEYLQGLYGRPPQDPDPELRRFVLGQDEPISVRPADLLDPAVEGARARLAAQGAPAGDGEVLHELLFPTLAARLRQSQADAAAEPNGENGHHDQARGAEETEQQAEAAEASGAAPSDGAPPPAPAPAATTAEFQVEVEGEVFTVRVSGAGMTVSPQPAGGGGAAAPGPPAAPPRGAIVAPMQGLIVKIPVQVGDEVGLGDVVAVLEAMKMQNDIVATQPGRVVEILVHEGDVVSPNQPLVAVG
jgi:pyruvate carboxylase subunit B